MRVRSCSGVQGGEPRTRGLVTQCDQQGCVHASRQRLPPCSTFSKRNMVNPTPISKTTSNHSGYRNSTLTLRGFGFQEKKPGKLCRAPLCAPKSRGQQPADLQLHTLASSRHRQWRVLHRQLYSSCEATPSQKLMHLFFVGPTALMRWPSLAVFAILSASSLHSVPS